MSDLVERLRLWGTQTNMQLRDDLYEAAAEIERLTQALASEREACALLADVAAEHNTVTALALHKQSSKQAAIYGDNDRAEQTKISAQVLDNCAIEARSIASAIRARGRNEQNAAKEEVRLYDRINATALHPDHRTEGRNAMTSAIERAARAMEAAEYHGDVRPVLTAFLSEDEEMVERVARGMCAALGYDWDCDDTEYNNGIPEDDDAGISRTSLRVQARAAIAALREMATSATALDQ